MITVNWIIGLIAIAAIIVCIVFGVIYILTNGECGSAVIRLSAIIFIILFMGIGIISHFQTQNELKNSSKDAVETHNTADSCRIDTLYDANGNMKAISVTLYNVKKL